MARPPLLAAAAAVLLAAPLVLAFFDGGYGDRARLVAGVGAWALAAIAAVAAPVPFPRGGPARTAVAGLAGLLALTLASLAWAPLAAVAYADAQRVALYLGALVAGLALLGLRAAVPALAAAAAAIVLVGLSERLVPGLVTLERSPAAGGRLAAPLGYWNAMGAMAAMGLVLCAGLAGDLARAPRTRVIAAAAAPALGAGIALSFSRGALLAAAAGLAVLVAARPERAQIRAAGLAVVAGAAAGVVAALLPAVGDLEAADGARAGQGALLLAVLVAAAAGAGETQRRLQSTFAMQHARPRRSGRRRRALVAGVAVAVVVAGGLAVALGDTGDGDPAFGARAERLGSVESNRYAYWRVALATFADHPLAGAGSGAFGAEWLRRRDIPAGARDAHSLPIETAAELGIAGLLALALLVGGVVAGAARLQRRAPGAGAAAFGGMAAWSAHAAIDWGWEMPSPTLVALLLAAAVLAACDQPARS